jgi:hypothetical protein
MANTLKFKTEVDASGFSAGIKKVESEAKNAGNGVKNASKSAANSVKSDASSASSKVSAESKKAEQQAKSAGTTVQKAADSASDSIKKGASSASDKVRTESTSASRKAQTDMQSTQRIGEGVFKKIGGAIIAAFSVDAVINFGQQCIETFKSVEQNSAKLTQIMQNRMNASKGDIDEINNLMSKQSQTGVISANAQRGGAQQLATFLKSKNALKELIPAMNDLGAQQKGVNATSEDMVNYGNMIGKVMQGQTGALKRVGITFDESEEKAMKYGSEEQRAAALAKVLENNVGGVNKKLGQTDTGKMAIAQHQIDGLKAKIGEQLLPVVGRISGAMVTFMLNCQKAAPAIKMVAAGIGAIVAVFAVQKLISSIGMIKNAVTGLFTALAANPVALIVGAIAAVTVGLIELYKHNKRFRDFCNQMFGEIRTVAMPLINLLKQGIASLSSFFQAHASTFKKIGNALLTALMVGIKVIVTVIKAAIVTITAIIKAVIVVIQTVIKVVKAVGNAFKTVFGAIGGFVQKGAGLVVKGFKTIVNGAKKVGDLPGKFLNWGKDMMENLKNGIENGWKKVKGALNKVLGWIKDRFHFSTPDEGPLSDFDTWAPDAMQTMAQGIEDNLSVVQAPLNKLGTVIKSGMQNAMKTSGTSAKGTATVTAQTPAVTTASTQAFQPVANAANQQTLMAKTDTQKNLVATREFIANQSGPFKAVSYSLFNQITTSSKNRTDAAKMQSNNAIQGVRGFMQSQVLPFHSTSYGLFSQIYDASRDRMNATQTLTQTMINNIISWIRARYGNFYSAGRYTMQGFANGMNAERATIVNTSNSLVQAVKDAFVKGLGIHSPSVWMDWAGKNTGLGWVRGFNRVDLGKLARSKVNDMKGAFKNALFDANLNVDYMGDDSMKEVNWMRKYDGGSVVNGNDGGKGGRFVNNMLKLVNDDSHGYSQSNRWGPDYDCSSSIITALRWAGFNTGNASYTGNMSSELTKHGWERLPYRNPKRGDILLNDATHVELALGGLINAGFHSAHGHPEPGDQAHEAYVGRDPGGWAAILRYKNGFGDSLADAIEEAYNFKKYGYGVMDAEGDGGENGAAASGKLSDWVKAALKLTGQPESLTNGLIRAAKAESGGNPRAVNNWDINAKLGHPSKGLMQTIDSTFNAYKLPGHGNIWNPVDNMAAAIRYMIARYGSVEKVLKPRSKHWYGYAVGSRYITSDQFAMLHEGEAVIRRDENPYRNSRGGFITPMLEKIVLGEMTKIADRAVGGIRTVESRGLNDRDLQFTQVVNFKETPKQPSEFRAALRMEGRRLAFGR